MLENLKKLQKNEAINRLRILQMNFELLENVVTEFEQDDKLYYSEYINQNFLFREKDFDFTLLDSRINTDFYQICEQRYQEEKRSRKNNGIISKLKSLLER